MEQHPQFDPQRKDDSGWAKFKRDATFIGSMVMAGISIGGFIATVHIMGTHQEKQDALLDGIATTLSAQVGINTELKTMQNVTDNRLKSIEDWRNGVSDIYITGHRRH